MNRVWQDFACYNHKSLSGVHIERIYQAAGMDWAWTGGGFVLNFSEARWAELGKPWAVLNCNCSFPYLRNIIYALIHERGARNAWCAYK